MKRQRGNDLVIYQVASPELALRASPGFAVCFAVFALNPAYRKGAAVLCSALLVLNGLP